MLAENMKCAISADGLEVGCTIPIGCMPREGVPGKDKNGADIYSVPNYLRIATYDHITGKVYYEHMTTFTEERSVECKEVRTRSRSVIVSANESLAVFDPISGELVKMKPEDAIGKLVPIAKKAPGAYGCEKSADYGWVLGMFLSDGWLSRNTVGLAKQEDCKRDRFVSVCRKEFSDNFVVNTYDGHKEETGKLGDSTKIHCNGKDLYKCFEDLNLCDSNPAEGRQALTKRIPSELLDRLSREALIGMLSGLLDGDGSIIKNTAMAKPRFGARFSTSSPGLRDGLCELAYRLGIRYGITTTAPRGFSNTAYTINLSVNDVYGILPELVCSGAHEQHIIAEWLENPPAHDKQDSIPIFAAEAAIIRPLAYQLGLTGMYAAVSKRTTEYFTAARSTIERFIAVCGEKRIDLSDIRGLWDRAYNKNVIFEPVKEVLDAGTRDVYDVAVDNTKVFLTNNGLVIYDTTNFHVPVSKKAIDEAYAKMMPERNLIGPRFSKIMYPPEKEYLQGLYMASRRKDTSKAPKTFDNLAAARKAYAAGKIDIDDPIIIAEEQK